MKISKSSLLSFVQCPQRYFLGYELGVRPKKRSSKLIIGRATHHLIASHFMGALTGEPCDLEQTLQDFWSRYDIENTDFAGPHELQAGMQDSFEMARLFLHEAHLDPLEVEYRFSLPVVNVDTGEVIEDLEFTGVIDLIDRIEGKNRVIEIKTRTRRPDPFDAETSMELTCYAYWLRFLDDEETVPASYANIIKSKTPYIHWQNQERTTRDFVELFHTLRTVSRNISEGRFYKSPGLHCGWCDFRPVCAGDRDALKERFSAEAVERLREHGLIRAARGVISP